MVCCIYVGFVLWVFGHAEVVVEFDAEFTSPVHGLVVEMVESCMSFDDMVDTYSVVTVEKWFVEPDDVSLARQGFRRERLT